MVCNRLKLTEKTPDVYVKNSRDFQLFCRIFDVVYNAIKSDTDSIALIGNTRYIHNNLLSLLSDKVGFFEHSLITEYDLRLILEGFPIMIKNKGTLQGIIQAINLFLKISHITEKPTIIIDNEKLIPGKTAKALVLNNEYKITIHIEATIKDTSILDKLLYYIIPTGYKVSYGFIQTDTVESVIYYSDNENNYSIYSGRIKEISDEETEPRNLGYIDTTSTLFENNTQ